MYATNQLQRNLKHLKVSCIKIVCSAQKRLHILRELMTLSSGIGCKRQQDQNTLYLFSKQN